MTATNTWTRSMNTAQVLRVVQLLARASTSQLRIAAEAIERLPRMFNQCV